VDVITSCLAIFGASSYRAPREWLAAVAAAARRRIVRQRRQRRDAGREAEADGEGGRRGAEVERLSLGPRDVVELLEVASKHPGMFILLPGEASARLSAAAAEPRVAAGIPERGAGADGEEAAQPPADPPTSPLLELLLLEAAEQADSLTPRQVLQVLRATASLLLPATTGGLDGETGSPKGRGDAHGAVGSFVEAVRRVAETSLETSGALAPLLGAIGAATAEAPLSLTAVEVTELLRVVTEVRGMKAKRKMLGGEGVAE